MPHVTEEIWTNLPARETRLIVAPWPEPADVGGRVRGDRERADRGAHLPAQRRPHQARRATRPDLRGGRAPDRRRPGRRRGRARARPEGDRPRRADAREREVRRERRTRSGRRPSARSSRNTLPSATRWVESLSPWPADGFGHRADARAAARARRPAAAVRGDPRRRHERQVDDDAADRGAPARRRALGRRLPLAARERLERADPGRRRGGRLRARRSRPCGRRPRSSARRSSRCSRRPRCSRSRQRRSTSPSSRRGSAAGTTRRTSSTRRVVVLTNVALDHMDVLGDTREAIARREARGRAAGCTRRPRASRSGASSPSERRRRVVVTAHSNLALAVAAAESFLGRPVDPHAADGVALPGRFERRGERPLEIWDGAHNLAGVGWLLPRLPRSRGGSTSSRSILARQARRDDARGALGARLDARRDGELATAARSRPPSSPRSPRRTSSKWRPCPIRRAARARALELAGAGRRACSSRARCTFSRSSVPTTRR